MGPSVSVVCCEVGNPRAALRVLLVDDVPTGRLVGSRLLESLGCRVSLAEGGRAALNALQNQHFDLVFMDCQMPGMDGYEATEAIRRAEASTGRRIPIVALTASSEASVRERCEAVGMDDFVSKPVCRQDLERILSMHFPERPIQRAESREAQRSRKGPGAAALRLQFRDMFIQASRAQLDELSRAIEACELLAVGRSAHAFKGGCGTLATPRLVELAEAIEAAAERLDLSGAAELCRLLGEELERSIARAVCGAGDE